MDDAFGNPLTVEVADLLEEVVIFERGRTAAADGPLRLVVRDRMTLPGGEGASIVLCVVILLRHNAAVYAAIPSGANELPNRRAAHAGAHCRAGRVESAHS